jgi:hypothetical protein
VCVAVGAAYNWVPFGPQATLFDNAGGQVMSEIGLTRRARATTSAVWRLSEITSDGQMARVDQLYRRTTHEMLIKQTGTVANRSIDQELFVHFGR